MKLSTRRYLLWLSGRWVVIGGVGFSVGYALSAFHSVHLLTPLSDSISVAIFQACRVLP